jgi:DNA-binding response OmpR family regulator
MTTPVTDPDRRVLVVDDEEALRRLSVRVLERAGFEREGVKRRLLRHRGERVDATLFAIVSPDAD